MKKKRHFVPVARPGTKGHPLLSRTGVPGWETGTTAVSQPGQINVFVVVLGTAGDALSPSYIRQVVHMYYSTVFRKKKCFIFHGQMARFFNASFSMCTHMYTLFQKQLIISSSKRGTKEFTIGSRPCMRGTGKGQEKGTASSLAHITTRKRALGTG